MKISKQGNMSACENYREITLISLRGKVFNRVILQRMKIATDSDEQAGFRRNQKNGGPNCHALHS